MIVEVRSCKYGRGLFATRRIDVGEVFSRSPCLVLSKHDLAHISRTSAVAYAFKWDPPVLALGDAAMCNHSNEPNAIARPDDAWITLTALRRIEPDEEIFLYYSPTGRPT